MRIVGTRNRTGFESDPVKAYARARLLDAMLRAAMPPVARGVTRGSHRYFNLVDDRRRIEIARRINGP